MKNLFNKFFLAIIVCSFFCSAPIVQAEIISTWQTNTPLPYQVASNSTFTSNNILYQIGGSAEFGVNKPAPLYSFVDNAGNLSPWSTQSNMPKGLIWHSVSHYTNYLYVVGGSENLHGTNINNNVYKGVIQSDGSINAWQEVTPLPKRLALTGTAIVGNRIYVSGGFNESTVSSDIYYAVIASDGSLSAWLQAGTLANPNYGHGFFEHNGYFYTIGGRNTENTNAVYRQLINVDGSVGNPEVLESLPVPVFRGGYEKVGNKLITVGGNSTNANINSVFHASILENGSLSSWSTSENPLPVISCCGSLEAVGNYLYYLGGHNGTSYDSTVFSTTILNDNPSEPISNLPVNLLKQSSPPWENSIYDSANLWNPQAATINRWGCALTSATMVLNFHGITKIDNTTSLDPGSLNLWLKSQPDGYVGNGLLNWLAITRLSKQAKVHNPTFIYDALEYKKIRGMDNAQLDTDLSNGNPDILEVPGHFIVAKGKTADSYLVNDPFYDITVLSDSYENNYLSIGRFTPSHTDLSYIYLVTTADMVMTLKKKTGEVIAESDVQEPMIDPVTGFPSGPTMSMLLLPQPDTGDYEIHLSSLTPLTSHPYNLEVYVYDIAGNVKKFTQLGNTPTILPIHVDKTVLSNSSMKMTVTFEQFYQDLKALYQTKKIGPIVYSLLTLSIKDIENDFIRNKKAQAIKKIDLLRLVITKLSKKDASDPVKQLLLQDLERLRNYISR